MTRLLGRLSIRARITIGTLLIATLFFTGAAVVVRHQVETILQNATYNVLTSDAAPFETAIQQEPDEPVDNPGEGQLVAVIDPTGTTRTSTLPLPVTQALALGSLDLGMSGPQRLSAADADYLVAVERVASPGGDWTIVSARNENASREVLGSLTVGLIAGLVALTLLFGIASWILTGAALRPVTQLRRSADTIVATDSSALLPVGPADDEITDLATTLNTLITQLRSAAARERQMVSDASHELRTPLAVLQAQLELLRTGEPAQLETDLASAERATARLGQLVDSLLELSRLDSGTAATSASASASLGSLFVEAGEALDRARLSAAGGGGEVEIELVLPLVEPRGSVGMAALRYGRVLDNLLANALRALRAGDGLAGDGLGGAGGSGGVHGRITVVLSVEADRLITTVTDDGPGISPEFRPHAFDRFSQGDESRAAGDGSGLGLAIVAAAAAAAGGTANLADAAGGGLIVSVTLPIVAEEAESAPG